MYSHAITRLPPQTMAGGITSQTDSVDVQRARVQHQSYIKTLETLGIDVTILDPEEDYPDSHFVEDTAIIHKKTAVLTRPGAMERRGEVERIRAALEQRMPVMELDQDASSFVDGGDVLFMGRHVFIGISHRTNLPGAVSLKARLQTIDPELAVHFVPFTGVLHLKSGITALGDDILLGNPELKLHEALPAGKIVWLPAEQGYAANALVVNKTGLYFSECPAAGEAIEKAGLKPIGLDLGEFRKMDGSFTCLSLLW